jgi:hypothetical protein
MTRGRWFALALSLVGLIAVLGVALPRPRSVVPADAEPRLFSGERAVLVLARLLADQRPHPTGSPANRAVRERLEAELGRLGLEFRVQRGTSCGQYGICANVENVIAEIPGEIRQPAIALAAHYDSVPAGPGAADDGAGVAAMLEIARALRASEPLPRSVIFVFTDGEEMGLLGARWLVKDSELVRRLGVIVNLEGRGVSGPSLMFETSTPNDGLVSAFASAASRPVTSSGFYAVYKQLPNDTDLTIFRRAGIAGVNFAFIGGTAHYHTPSDDLAHLSRASLQHQGEQALSLVRELAGSAALPPLRHSTVFFDWFGRAVLSCTVPLFRALSFVLVVLGVALWFRLSRRDARRRRAASYALLSCISAIALAAALASLLDAGLRLRGSLDQPWPANARVILLAAEVAALLGLTSTGALLGRRFELDTGFLGFWLLELGMTAISAWLLPEAGYLFFVPALAATLLATLFLTSNVHAAEIAVTGAAVAQTLVWAPVAGLAFDALGVAVPALCAALGALVGLPLLAFVAALSPVLRQRLTAGVGFLALISGAVALAGDARSAEAPARVSIAHQLDLDSGKARWLLDAVRVPPELAAIAAFNSNGEEDFPWFGGGLLARFQAPAPALSRPSPRAELMSEKLVNGGRELELSFSAGEAGALALNVGFPADVSSHFAVDGEPATPVVSRGRAVLGLLSPAAGGVRVRLRVAGSSPIPVLVAECASGLPPEGRALAARRNGPSSASQTGDISITSRSFRF